VRSGNNPNSARVRDKVKFRVDDRLRKQGNLHLWLWRPLDVVAPGYGEPEYDQVRDIVPFQKY